jgi:hypothetical protein
VQLALEATHRLRSLQARLDEIDAGAGPQRERLRAELDALMTLLGAGEPVSERRR